MLYVEQKINFNKSKTELKMKNLTHTFKETNLVNQLMQESHIKSKTMSWSSQKKKECIYFVRRKFFNICFVLMYSETFRIFLLLHIKKLYFIHFLLVFKIVESLQSIHKLVKQTQKISVIIQVILTIVFYQLFIWICSSYEWKIINRTLYKI